MTTAISPEVADLGRKAKEKLDQQTVEMTQWHFHESTGSPFWLEQKRSLNFDPLKEIKSFEDLKKFPLFEDDLLRGGPVRFMNQLVCGIGWDRKGCLVKGLRAGHGHCGRFSRRCLIIAGLRGDGIDWRRC